MTIGEALKEEQDRLGLTEEEMVQGIMSKSAYSRVINNKRNIGSDILVKLLFTNNIDVANFFKKIEDTYSPDKVKLEKKLSSEMAEAVNNHELEKINKCYEKIEKSNINLYLKKRAKLVVAFFNNNLDQLSIDFKKSILDDLNKNENWIFNIDVLGLFSSSLIILPPKNIEAEIEFFFRKIKRITDISDVLKERYAVICDNYLHWKYVYLRKNEKQIQIDQNVEAALNYLRQLESTPHMIIYLISARYYLALFTDNLQEAKKIKKNLIDAGCNLVVKNWPV